MKKVYYNGNIVTMSNIKEEIDAVMVSDGVFSYIGKYDELVKNNSLKENTQFIDLKGNTILPGFIDSHSHFAGVASKYLFVSMENVYDLNDVIEILNSYIMKNNVKTGDWLVAKGFEYDFGKSEITVLKSYIDSLFSDYYVVIEHISSHMGIFNNKAVEFIKEKIKDKGELINLNGIAYEKDYTDILKCVPMKNVNDYMNGFKMAQDLYASCGITTAQEGMLISQLADLYNTYRCKDELKIEIICYVDINEADIIETKMNGCYGKYDGGVKIGGYKLFLDGSGSGKTASLMNPYEGTSDCGKKQYSDEKLVRTLEKIIKQNVQFISHCNGDAACEQLINSYEKAIRNICKNNDKCIINDIRPIIIHAMLLNEEQLKKAWSLGIIPSFYVENIYNWGDGHINNLGYERSEKICITKTAANNKIPFTIHSDAPVLKPDIINLIVHAIERKTKKGVILGENECISVYEALEAVTINAAYQYKEEKIKGSIEIGKQADFIILNQNPLKCATNQLKNISILETYKKGKCIYKKNK